MVLSIRQFLILSLRVSGAPLFVSHAHQTKNIWLKPSPQSSVDILQKQILWKNLQKLWSI